MHKVSTKRPIWLGFLIAPLAGPALYTIGAGILDYESVTNNVIGFLGHFIVFTIFLSPFSYIAVILLGGPFIYYLKTKNKLTFWRCTIGAIPLGVLSFPLLGLIFNFDSLKELFINFEFTYKELVEMSIAGTLGFSVSTIFCLVVGIKKYA